MEINIKELKEQMEWIKYNNDVYPTDAWCPTGCGLVLVQTEENIYYCAQCNKDFKIIEVEESNNGTRRIKEKND